MSDCTVKPKILPCRHCGSTPQILRSSGLAAHACFVTDKEIRMTVDDWNSENVHGYEGGETNWERCFGTPERAAASLANHFVNCENGICTSNDIRYDEWLEWLRIEDAFAVIGNEVDE